MYKKLRFIQIIFFLACCGLFFFIPRLLSVVDAKNVEKGDFIDNHFPVLIFKRDGIAISNYEDVLTFGLPDGASFVNINEFQGVAKDGISYRIKEISKDYYMVSITCEDHDRKSWVRYEIEDGKITPKYYRIFSFDYMFASFPYILISILGLYFLKRKLTKQISLHLSECK